MAKNYASIYNGGNDAIALEQRWYAKKELVRGTMIAPTGADFFYANQGGQITFTQPKTSSPTRSDRMHTSFIREKKSTEWSFPTLVMVDTSVAAGATEVDPGIQVLWESLLGRKTISSGVIFDPATPPASTFTLFECGDLWAEQSFGAFVNSAELAFPGDGQATMTWSGNAKTRYLVGIGKSVVANTGNDITLAAGETYRFPIGSMVMIIESNGTTRSADTPDGSPRTVTAVDHLTNKITLSGAALADADGSTTPIYVVYYEPASPVGINDPQTGLVGSVSIDNLPSMSCVRNTTISINNNHELVNYCYGSDSLSGKLFVPGSRLDVMVSMEFNLDANVVEYINKLQNFIGNSITLICGDAADRHLKIEMPKVVFDVPAIAVPESGSIPVTFENGMALQTALDANDCITVKYL